MMNLVLADILFSKMSQFYIWKFGGNLDFALNLTGIVETLCSKILQDVQDFP